MPIRDIVITAFIAGVLPVALFRPFVAISLWTWLSVMNPHRLTWGFAYNLPFAMLSAIATFFSLASARKEVKFPVTAITVTMILFLGWMTVTFLNAINFSLSYEMWSRVTKVLVMTLVAFAIVRTEKQIRIFVWILVMSVAFYGIKGGVFTILNGGQFLVWGPPNSLIQANNAISVALVMMVPLLVFLYQQLKRAYLKLGMAASILLCIVSVLGSYSRTAFVAGCAMLAFLTIKSRRAGMLILLMAFTLPIMLAAMPQKWWDRMETIATGAVDGEWDRSVQGRFNSWAMAWNLAKDRPITGGGFAVYEDDVFARYAPDPEGVHSAHSIYFQILGEHGFVGLALFLLLGAFAWRTANRVIRLSQSHEVQWRANLARSIQVSMIGFFIGGLALNIGYWDVYYFELVVLTALEGLALSERAGQVVSRHGPSVISSEARA